MYGFSQGSLCLLLYFIICVAVVFSIRLLFRIPTEVFRKLLHWVLLGSLAVWLWAFAQWQHALLAVVCFLVLVYPLLHWAEHHLAGYSRFVTERKQGELKQSFVLVFSMFALVVAVGWALCGDKNLCLAAICAWGPGDAAAALVGKRFGRHHLEGRHIEGRKSVEGTAAMACVSFAFVLPVLLCRGDLGVGLCLVAALVCAAVTAVTELYSLRGNDTFFCPVAALAVLLPFTLLTGGAL